jgi:copper chaperone NosL
MNRLHPATRILLALALCVMASAWFLPAWEIQLWAPQYPEGLNMKIWLDKLGGDFEIINGLNHYIGMKQIKAEMFPEFRYMKPALLVLLAIGALPVITGRRFFLWAFVVILFLAGGLGIWDFWRWGHDYGHNLDPHAAISVPGMTYDPPLIGYKNLLNFTAYSGPDWGGYAMIGAGVAASILLVWELWRNRGRKSATGGKSHVSALLIPFLLLAGCESGPQPIDYGKDECAECNMTLVDKHYGTELVTTKGKVFKFDDVNCMIEFARRDPAKHAGTLHVIDFNTPNQFIPAENAVYLHHKKLRSPMRGDVAAFQNLSATEAVMAKLGDGGKILNWQEVQKLF